jgi:hypothetical protein
VTAALPAAERDKLGKVLALLDSSSDGERDAAICMATKILARHGLRWSEVLNLQPPPKREPLHSTWRTTCHRLQERAGYLRPWEKRFVSDLPHFSRISTKQRYLLKEIADRVLGEHVA